MQHTVSLVLQKSTYDAEFALISIRSLIELNVRLKASLSLQQAARIVINSTWTSLLSFKSCNGLVDWYQKLDSDIDKMLETWFITQFTFTFFINF